MSNLRRDDRIKLFQIGGNGFEGRNKAGDIVLNDCDDYFIYMKNVNLLPNNVIDGRYLGTLTKDSPIIDDRCKEAVSNGKAWTCDGKVVKTAKMVAINNKTNVLIVIQNK